MKALRFCVLLVGLIGQPAVLQAAALGECTVGEFAVREPLGFNWPGEWVRRTIRLDPRSRLVRIRELHVYQQVHSQEIDTHRAEADLEPIPAQFYRGRRLLRPDEPLIGGQYEILCQVSLKKDATTHVVVTSEPATDSRAPEVQVESGIGGTIANGVFRWRPSAESYKAPLGILEMGNETLNLEYRWPADVKPTASERLMEEVGPARVLMVQRVRFKNSDHHYEVRFDIRAGDPWIGIEEHYALGPGTMVEVDLSNLHPDHVYHPHTYNARTFKPDGQAEDTPLQPPQHPVATLGPIWRDIWYGGGSHAFVYNSRIPYGIGFATVRGSQWKAADGVSLPSQNLRIEGDKAVPCRVRLRLPTDGGRRHWAIIAGPIGIRTQIASMIRSHADIPLQRVVDEWTLEWDSEHPEYAFGLASAWFGPFNRHELNPTTFPRRVRSALRQLLDEGRKVKSRDLAFLAYVFSDPDYWPGPEYQWGNVGNPNFHTDMYNVPLQIGLVMPDHPHASRWTQHGLTELKRNIERDSFPGGAWAESISYSSFYFHVAEYAWRIKQAGLADPFHDWPRLKEVAIHLACMHTPVDPRYGSRQRAPIGDTHPGNYIEELHRVATYYRGVDDAFAEQLARFPERWPGALDLSSRTFPGFGAMLRGNAYDARHESFVTLKAGPARNHYQGDELSFHFCSLGVPLAIDHACHYSPRPWSASMHNRPDMNGLRPVTVAVPRAFAASPAADVFVADEQTRRISHVPMEPHHTIKPGWEYPTTVLPESQPWRMRRYAMLVKHDPEHSRLADYLVVRDEIESPQPVWWNLHVLARRIERQGRTFIFEGQLDVDLAVTVLGPPIETPEYRRWGWSHERTRGTLKDLKGEAYEKEHFGHVIPADFEPGTWGETFEHSGESTQWLRLPAAAGRSDWLVVLMPYLKGSAVPTVESIGPGHVRITVGDELEEVRLGTEAGPQAMIEQRGRRLELLPAGHVPALGVLDDVPSLPTDPGAR